jgi:hypothetical protein
MFRALLILAIGVAIGYSVGYKDARKHDKSIVERTLDRAGGSARGKYDSDIDKRLESAKP